MRICFCNLHQAQLKLFQRAGLGFLLKDNVFDDMAAAVEQIESQMPTVIWRSGENL
jgi:hypothetical protein